jgi:glycosyltransferase involved in cell wall biosynthesis
MRAASALHADCVRDAKLSTAWGFGPDRPTLVVPGNGGVRTDVFHPPSRRVTEPVVLNPRGPRAYVRNDTFFAAIPTILAHRPEARFVCAAMAGDKHAVALVNRLGIASSVELIKPMPHEQMADLYRRAQVLVSPSVHDGTPNSLLEGMASGCFPIAGELDSVREWITHGRNGLLVDPNSPQLLAEAILIALDREDLRREAAGLNRKIIASRAEFSRCMTQADDLYGQTAGRR